MITHYNISRLSESRNKARNRRAAKVCHGIKHSLKHNTSQTTNKFKYTYYTIDVYCITIKGSKLTLN